MIFLADTHVHVYGCYEADAVFAAAEKNFLALETSDIAAASSQIMRVLFLTERFDCDFFSVLRTKQCAALAARYPNMNTVENNIIELQSASGKNLLVVAGRQIVTAERLEVLALGMETKIPDGNRLDDVIDTIRSAGGLPVLNWAPGKWLSGRGRVIEKILLSRQPGDLLVGDVSLRPVGWPMPRLLRLAIHRGFGLVAGSDPLPFPGEERQVGSLAVAIEAPDDRLRSWEGIKATLSTASSSTQLRVVGHRGWPWAVFWRLFRNELVRRR